jgi:hypothetical protein
MTQLHFGPWILRADPDATRRAYERIEQGSAEGCACDPCKNFLMVRDEAYPPDVRTLLESLGIDYRKETEICHYCRLPSGLQLYSGWFYFSGEVDSPEPWTTVGTAWKQEQFYKITPVFKIINFKQMDKPSPHFSEFPSVEMIFSVELPWRSDAPEPD